MSVLQSLVDILLFGGIAAAFITAYQDAKAGGDPEWVGTGILRALVVIVALSLPVECVTHNSGSGYSSPHDYDDTNAGRCIGALGC